MAKYWVGVDIGGTNIVCGLLDEQFNLLSKKKRTTEVSKGNDYVMSNIANMIDLLLQEASVDRSLLRAVGLGTPGFVDPDRGISLFASNLGWRDFPIAQRLQSFVGVPVFCDNDVRMYVYGEAMRGAAQGYSTVLGITLGTGLSAAVVQDGKLFYGGGYMAGEIGHIPMEGQKEPCGCGLVGCLETVASATGIVRQTREAIIAGRKSVLMEWFDADHLDSITAADVSKAYDAEDELAVEVMHFTGRLLGKGLSYAIPLYSPDVIVIGGGAALAGERLFAPMREEIKRSVYPGYWERLSIQRGALIDDGGVIGSAAFAKSRL